MLMTVSKRKKQENREIMIEEKLCTSVACQELSALKIIEGTFVTKYDFLFCWIRWTRFFSAARGLDVKRPPQPVRPSLLKESTKRFRQRSRKMEQNWQR